MLIWIIIIVLSMFIIGLGIMIFRNREAYSSWSSYLSKIYPPGVQKDVSSFNFFYMDCLPSSLASELGPLKPDDMEVLPKFKELWFPVWFHKGTAAINLYNPSNPLEYPLIDGIKDYQWAEFMHTNDTQDFYTVYGLWAYYTNGSGVSYNIGRSLKAQTKIKSLAILGLSIEDIAGLLRTLSFLVNTNQSSQTVISFVNSRYQQFSTESEKLDALVRDLLFGPFDYDIDRVNNTADLDGYITMLARDKGYDSVQFTMAANGHGGWAHEIVWVHFQDLVKQNEKNWSGWSKMQKSIACTTKIFDGMLVCEDSNITSCMKESGTNVPKYY